MPVRPRWALLAAAVAIVAAAPPQATDELFRSENVEELTEDTFDERIRAGGEWFVKFYAPWCGHCRHLAPTWHDVGDQVKGDDGIHIAQVDCSRNGKLAARFEVRGFPTLKHLSLSGEGEVEVRDYGGSRSASALVEYARGGWRAAAASSVGGRKADGSDGPGLFDDLMDFAGRHVVLTVLFFVATSFVLLGAVLLVLDMTGTIETDEGLALRTLVDPETGLRKEA